MKRIVTSWVLASAVICFMATCAGATANVWASWALHYAGPHNAKVNTCALEILDCRETPSGDVNVNGPSGPGRFDVYLIAVESTGIAGSRYGICCEGSSFYYYGWTNCADLEIATPTWPGCGEGNAQTWFNQQPPGNVTMGIVDVYVYGESTISICPDPRKGFAEWCDGTAPDPNCWQTTAARDFGVVGFGTNGYSPCIWDAVEPYTWGTIKGLYR